MTKRKITAQDPLADGQAESEVTSPEIVEPTIDGGAEPVHGPVESEPWPGVRRIDH